MKSRATLRTETAVAEPPERSREERYRQAAELLREWKDDETSYDDEVWPLVEERTFPGYVCVAPSNGPPP
jgi:hypothetical protein